MTNIETNDISRSIEMAFEACKLITSQTADYFSTHSHAKSYAITEGIDASQIAPLNDRYVWLPRKYPSSLQPSLLIAVDRLTNEIGTPFLHVDRNGITAGVTADQSVNGSLEQPLTDLKPNERNDACDLVIAECELLVDPLDSTFDVTKQIVPSRAQGPVALRLGRNILTEVSEDVDFERAARDTDRDWEIVLAVGGSAITSYGDAVQEYANQKPKLPTPPILGVDKFKALKYVIPRFQQIEAGLGYKID